MAGTSSNGHLARPHHNSTCFFNDGQRRVDFVLVYDKDEIDDDDEMRVDKDRTRLFFHNSLIKCGLQLEIENDNNIRMGSVVFVKVHAPFPLLCKQAESLKLKMPLRVKDPFATVQDEFELARDGNFFENHRPEDGRPRVTTAEKIRRRAVILKNLQERPKRPIFPVYRHPKQVLAAFRQNKSDAFEIGDSEEFFSPAQRSAMVWEILQHARNDETDGRKRGIELLLEQGLYQCAFPLHDSDLEKIRENETNLITTKSNGERKLLHQIWANWKCTFRAQPIFLIRRYFGEKIAFYFSFMGFYTHMLIWPSLFSVCAFLYGLFYQYDDEIVKEACNGNTEPGNWTMCPLCRPPDCVFFQLSDSCSSTVWTYRMDNEATMAMCILIIVWSTVFLKWWRRRESELSYEWNTNDLDRKENTYSVRPAYEERARGFRANGITGEQERYVPIHLKLLWTIVSYSISILLLSASCVALASMIVARISLYRRFRSSGAGAHQNVDMARWLVHTLIFMVVYVFDGLYGWMAERLTWLECPRTETQWSASFLWKVFAFQLLNNFVPIVYAGWVKGNTVHTPLELDWNSELCDPSGCLLEVTELVVVLLCARLAVRNLYSIGWPALKNLMSKLFGSNSENENTSESRWEADYKLNEADLDGVSAQYMEIMVQFAFVTLLAPALPLIPLVCLLNNILQIRLDAINFVISRRRPVPVRASGIEVWYHFLNIISKLGIICNAAVVSFTSDIVPRLYFKYTTSDGSYDGFHKFVLSQVPTSAFPQTDDISHGPIESEFCYYRGFRMHTPPYLPKPEWWHIACFRLLTFSIFILFGFSFQFFYGFVVPDVPTNIQLQIQRRRYMVNKTLESISIADAAAAEQQAAAIARNVHTGEKKQQTVKADVIGPSGDQTELVQSV